MVLGIRLFGFPKSRFTSSFLRKQYAIHISTPNPKPLAECFNCKTQIIWDGEPRVLYKTFKVSIHPVGLEFYCPLCLVSSAMASCFMQKRMMIGVYKGNVA